MDKKITREVTTEFLVVTHLR